MVRVHAGPQDFKGERGDVAQAGERLPCTEEVRGSNPLISISVDSWRVGWRGPRQGPAVDAGSTLTHTMNRQRKLREVQRLRITWKKLIRAYGGCLGNKSRRRTWYTAKSLGEPCAGGEPGMSEWGNPRQGSWRTSG